MSSLETEAPARHCFSNTEMLSYFSCNDLGNQDEVFFDALVRMFEEALKVIGQLPAPDRDALIARLDRVRITSHNFRLRRRRRYGLPVRQALENLTSILRFTNRHRIRTPAD